MTPPAEPGINPRKLPFGDNIGVRVLIALIAIGIVVSIFVRLIPAPDAVGKQLFFTTLGQQYTVATSEQYLADYLHADVTKRRAMIKDGQMTVVPAYESGTITGYGSEIDGAKVYHILLREGTEPLGDGWVTNGILPKK